MDPPSELSPFALPLGDAGRSSFLMTCAFPPVLANTLTVPPAVAADVERYFDLAKKRYVSQP